jgi:hypothetical protein
MSSGSLSQIDFGHPEAEHDNQAIEQSFYEAESWKAITTGRGVPFVVGRKGSGKSAIAARLQYTSRQNSGCCFLRIIPASFRHVEIRDLLACLVNKNTSWQYIYRKVWEGILLGQIIRHLEECEGIHAFDRLPGSTKAEVQRFKDKCGFYVAAIGDALSDVITNHVRKASKKTDALSQVELRKMLEPYAWNSLTHALQAHFWANGRAKSGMYIAIDGLDEHWDVSDPSMFFLAELLAAAKNFTALFGSSIRFVVCLRDNIFRSLVDTKSIEYDKIESLVINLEWNSRSLFELIARRVAPSKRVDAAVAELRELLPETVDDMAVDDYLARHILQRPRDYVNFFRMLQEKCHTEGRAGEGHIHDALGKYSANRLVDLENEFGFTYPGISKLITGLHRLPELFSKEDLLEAIQKLTTDSTIRAEAAKLLHVYSAPIVLARILVSIGVIGIYDSSTHGLRFVHEFSETRVTAMWDAASQLGLHPVYCYNGHRRSHRGPAEDRPAILTHPSDYLAEKDSPRADLQNLDSVFERKRKDLAAQLSSIQRGQPHFRRYEDWTREVMATCFVGDLTGDETQIISGTGTKRFEIIFDVVGNQPPWAEIRDAYKTHRLLVECKNTDEPTDADFAKLDRDLQSLGTSVAFLAYRGDKREPKGKALASIRSVFVNSNRSRVIMVMSDPFLLQCLDKRTPEKARQNLNSLWRDHVQRYLTT